LSIVPLGGNHFTVFRPPHLQELVSAMQSPAEPWGSSRAAATSDPPVAMDTRVEEAIL
jgi:hypothetical protein